ncbi:hypothetical protein EVAR_50902_1 [Eumeta japonica]|uniref:Uncharacterized protein n=1 Tax=Eumeta variegata TaxID=151549 RepID=A0A4C1YC21_EUMVA|nr:hypothetical protein EVAR_50902_1 [Eumeta japonica]
MRLTNVSMYVRGKAPVERRHQTQRTVQWSNGKLNRGTFEKTLQAFTSENSKAACHQHTPLRKTIINKPQKSDHVSSNGVEVENSDGVTYKSGRSVGVSAALGLRWHSHRFKKPPR